VPPGRNDADALADALAADGDTSAVLQRLRGPWAAVHWRAAARTLTFGRDVLGAKHVRSSAAYADASPQVVPGRGSFVCLREFMFQSSFRQAQPAGA
jgi:hypothetical protein